MREEIVANRPAFVFEGHRGIGNTPRTAAGDNAKIGCRHRRIGRSLRGMFAMVLRPATAGLFPFGRFLRAAAT
jgi:hypothetical protein